jgi:hypothetical protein
MFHESVNVEPCKAHATRTPWRKWWWTLIPSLFLVGHLECMGKLATRAQPSVSIEQPATVCR